MASFAPGTKARSAFSGPKKLSGGRSRSSSRSTVSTKSRRSSRRFTAASGSSISRPSGSARMETSSIVGASKIARDITELRKARDRQHLLMREMSPRVRHLFAPYGSIVGLSVHSAKSPQELAELARARLSALARAHDLTFSHGEDVDRPTTLQAVVRTIVAPFNEPEAPRITFSGIDAGVSSSAVTSLALLLHEFATNAVKYGALSGATGTVKVALAEEGDAMVVYWSEQGDRQSTRRGAARDSAACCREPRCLTNLAANLSGTGGLRDLRSASLFLERASLHKSATRHRFARLVARRGLSRGRNDRRGLWPAPIDGPPIPSPGLDTRSRFAYGFRPSRCRIAPESSLQASPGCRRSE